MQSRFRIVGYETKRNESLGVRLFLRVNIIYRVAGASVYVLEVEIHKIRNNSRQSDIH